MPEGLINELEDSSLLYLWSLFSKVRSSGKLTFSELYAWSKLTNYQLMHWEIDILFNLEYLLAER